MDLWLVLVLYVAGLGMIVLEAFMPGLVMGILGLAGIVVSVVFGFRHHWGIGVSQIVLAAGIGPTAVLLGIRRMQLRSTLGDGASFAQDYGSYAGKEGESQTELRPAGIVVIEGRKVDVVTSGEMIERGKRVRVVKVEGNRIVVRAV